jgi:hypothetical protein
MSEEIIDNLIARVADYMGFTDQDSIHESLISHGMSNDQIFFIMKAAEIIYKTRINEPRKLPFGRK